MPEPVIWMFAVLAVAIVAGVPIGFALILATLPPIIIEPRLTQVLLAQRIYNALDSFVLLAVPFFLLAGNLMNASGVTDRLIRFADALVGGVRGGLAHVNVLVSMLFAGVSGSSTADTAGVGSVMIPAMTAKGFTPSFSVAITAASSVLGTIIPPSIILVVWGAVTNTSVAQLFAAGVVPGVLIGLVQMAYILLVTRDERLEAPPIDHVPGRRRRAFRDALPGLLLPAILLGGITFGIATPTEASIGAVVYALFLGFFIYRGLTIARLWQELEASARLVALSLFCLGAAALFAWLLSYYGVPQAIAGLAAGATSPVALLIAIALVCLVLGLFLDALVIAVIVGPLFLPAVAAAGIDPVQYGIIACVALSLGLVTPPYGLCLLIASSIAGIPMHQALGDMARIFAAMLVVVAGLILLPMLTVWPAMMVR